MGVQAGGVHLPVHRMEGKRSREAGLQRGFEALRIPSWDEDPLTMAIEAGLELEAGHLAGVDAIRLFLADPSEQAGLAARALDLDVPVTQITGPAGLVAELANGTDREELWLAAGQATGGAGVALRVSEGEGVDVRASATVETSPLEPESSSALQRVLEELDTEAGVHRLTGPQAASLASQDPHGLAIGQAGPAAPGLELLAHRARSSEASLLAAAGGGQAHAVHLEEGSIPVAGLDAPSVEIQPEAYRRRQEAQPVPWSEASQGAYVSPEVYNHDEERRYGARARGEGEVGATTTIEAGPPGEFVRQHEAQGPYDVVIVELDEGGREIGQAAVPAGTLSIGDRVRPVLRRVFSMEEQVRYGLKWRTTREAAPAQGL